MDSHRFWGVAAVSRQYRIQAVVSSTSFCGTSFQTIVHWIVNNINWYVYFYRILRVRAPRVCTHSQAFRLAMLSLPFILSFQYNVHSFHTYENNIQMCILTLPNYRRNHQNVHVHVRVSWLDIQYKYTIIVRIMHVWSAPYNAEFRMCAQSVTSS